MKKILFLIILLAPIHPLSADYLFLTDGAIIKGKISSETAAEVFFRDEQKKVNRYSRGRVMRVVYTEINMGKVVVQKRDGKTLSVYIVDEDRTTYTFRKELYKPQEIKLDRSDVLFMAERNPSGLKGIPSAYNISLVWLPSYEKMKHYNIYLMKKGGKYGSVGKSKKASYNLSGLDGNTEYNIKVTGTSDDGDETTPSNELSARTADPTIKSPTGLTVNTLENSDRKLTWRYDRKPDLPAKLYRVYADRGDERKLIVETKDTTYTISGPIDYKRALVTAVDIKGAESIAEPIRLGKGEYSFNLTGGVVYPSGKLREIAGLGYGGALTFTKHELFMTGFEIGLSAGFYYLTGKDNIESDISKTSRAWFAPVNVNFGYRFEFSENLSLAPYIYSGSAYIDIPYVKRNSTGLDENKHLKEFGPIAGAGISCIYSLSDSLSFCLLFEHGILIQKEILNNRNSRLEIGAGIKI